MDEARRRPAAEPVEENQVRRAQRGVVAGYIHQLSERHAHGDAPDLNAEAAIEQDR